MRIGIHLPQYGRAASGQSIIRAAQHAEHLGFSDVWVSDHTVHPAGQNYPSAYLYDPLLSLTWAGAVTESIGLGTSVLVVPTHNPVALANALASLDALTGGRLIVGAGAGWSEVEATALGYDFDTRGYRFDESLDLIRAAWTQDPLSFDGDYYSVDAVRVLPQPTGSMPIWIGGTSPRALHRAISKGDGCQFIGLSPVECGALVQQVRKQRPESEFTISLRTGWDPQGMDPVQIQDEVTAYEAVGVQHVVCAPWRLDINDWIRSMELLASLAID